MALTSQADILIETRRAAELLGATRMDRPEDIEVNPVNGRVYLVLTGNDKREEAQTDAANPRAKNSFGHILELMPPGADAQAPNHAADEFRWNVFLLAGDPSDTGAGARYHPETSKDGWLTTPDNIAFDSRGRMWIATDGANDNGFADGVWATDVDGPGRALTRHFLKVPRGGEMCGPCFTPDDTTLFVAVQHPGQEPGSTYDTPSTRWPDFDAAMPPRPAIVAITVQRQADRRVSANARWRAVRLIDRAPAPWCGHEPEYSAHRAAGRGAAAAPVLWLADGGFVFVIMTFASGLGFYNISVILSALTREQGFSVSLMSAATAVFFIVSGFAGMGISRLITRFDIRLTIITGAQLWRRARWCCWPIAQRFGRSLWFTRCSALVLPAAIWCPGATLISRWFERGRAKALSIASTGLSMGGCC